MKKTITHLTLEERQEIYKMHSLGKKIREIGRVLKRPASTISRELKRNRVKSARLYTLNAMEKAKYAQDKARSRQRGKRKGFGIIVDRPWLGSRILTLLEDTNYSPEDIAYILSSSDFGIKLSGLTIRRWVQKYYRHYKKYFPHRGKRPRQCLTPKVVREKDKLVNKKSIHDRCEFANLRTRLGDFELDLIVCSQSLVNILSIRDRESRRCWLRLVKDKTSDAVKQEINRVIRDIHPLLRHTMTFDRGTEFTKANELEELLQMEAYFCDAYKSYQKGSVEQQNKEVRRRFPKGTDLSKITKEELQRVEDLINNKPRHVLNKYSAIDYWMIKSRVVLNNFIH